MSLQLLAALGAVPLLGNFSPVAPGEPGALGGHTKSGDGEDDGGAGNVGAGQDHFQTLMHMQAYQQLIAGALQQQQLQLGQQAMQGGDHPVEALLEAGRELANAAKKDVSGYACMCVCVCVCVYVCVCITYIWTLTYAIHMHAHVD